MINATRVTVIGRAAATPDLRYTPTGRPVASFDLAVTPRIQEAGTWKDGPAAWYRVTAWQSLAEHAAESITKGMRLIVVGDLSPRPWERDGRAGLSLDIRADAIGPDLTWADATVKVATRSSGPDDESIPPESD